MTDVQQRITALADLLAGNGDLTDPRWRDALHAVPRHLFVPDVAWATPYGSADGYRIDKNTDPEEWLDAAYGNQPIIIQLSDGAVDVGTGEGAYTSSLSAPDVVVDFLELLDPYDGDEVLEVGTGSGWTAGLLSARLGDRRVTSIEIDAALSERAAENLKSAGFAPRLIVGDGADGWAEGAPYDRVHVTCGVATVPHRWVTQTRPGGLIAFPWMPGHAGGHKTVLTALGDGTAVGRFHGGCGYMMMRAQRTFRRCRDDAVDWRESAGMLDPRRVIRASWGADVAVAAMLPDVSSAHETGGDGDFTLWLWTTDSDATVTHAPDHRRVAVRQRGPRNLWDEMTEAFLRWASWGEPGRDRFGLTVTPDGRRVWLDSPERVVSPPSSE